MPATDYEIEAVLDEGRFTRVLRGRRRRDGLAVVLKLLRPESAALAPRLEREYVLLRRISAPEVVAALALDEWQGLPALVLTEVEGVPLTAWIRRPRGVEDLAQRLRLALGLGRALAVVHAAGVLHRDLKPSNVLVKQGGDIVLIDFSAATLAQGDEPRPGEGTLQYMAPEQTGRTGRPVDARSDHYALGVTLYELFTGRLPFLDDDPLGLVHSHLARIPPAPQEVCPELPLPLAQAILKLIEKSPDARYQSIRGLRADLERCLEELLARGHVEAFTPGLHDVSPQLRLRETTTTAPAALDVTALLRASQAISGEIELDRLLRALVRIVLESAGARRCAVLLADPAGELRIEALADLDGVTVLQNQPLAQDGPLPAAILHLAARGRRDVILDDAQTGELAGDPTVAGLRSVLCTPILHHGALLGVLYLDNELAPGIFTAGRINLLRQLAGQVAVSVENARLYRNLAQARDTAISADRTKTRFLMNMSHELRTPLNAVLGYTELIEESAADGDLSALTADLAKIRRAAVRLLRTLSSILELSRIEAGDLRPALQPIDLPALIHDVVEEAAALAAEHGDEVCIHLPAAPIALISDRGMLVHALRSLLDNAIRFTPSGRVDISMHTSAIDGAPWLALSVQDTGIGIAPADLPRLFTSFGQLDDAPTRNVEGAGVSLALTHRFCVLLGGRIEVESEPGAGSRFTLHLPATPP